MLPPPKKYGKLMTMNMYICLSHTVQTMGRLMQELVAGW